MDRAKTTYGVREVAGIAGVTVRTLHHYDAIGLLPARGRTQAGYRWYAADDLLRLQQVLMRRAMGWPLAQIRRALDDPRFDHRGALLEQLSWLEARSEETESMARSVRRALAALEGRMEDAMNEERKLFDGFDPERHEDEAEARWGDTAAWAESKRRTAGYDAADWARYQRESHEILRALAALREADPTGPAVQALVEAHRCLIDRWFYPCDRATHLGLSELWTADPRFRQNMDAAGEGATDALIAGVRAAMEDR